MRFGADVVLNNEHQLLNKAQQRALIERLESNPTGGKPLRGSLKGCYRHRIGDLRAVYFIDEHAEAVVVFAIARRRDDEVYKIANGRAH